ncbi:hypothetical protein J6590_050777 [Homalodisca vitripennis]|nr:hypothetical protein J6590_050777 [Homalodisca vitripennis]
MRSQHTDKCLSVTREQQSADCAAPGTAYSVVFLRQRNQFLRRIFKASDPIFFCGVEDLDLKIKVVRGELWPNKITLTLQSPVLDKFFIGQAHLQGAVYTKLSRPWRCAGVGQSVADRELVTASCTPTTYLAFNVCHSDIASFGINP